MSMIGLTIPTLQTVTQQLYFTVEIVTGNGFLTSGQVQSTDGERCLDYTMVVDRLGVLGIYEPKTKFTGCGLSTSYTSLYLTKLKIYLIKYQR